MSRRTLGLALAATAALSLPAQEAPAPWEFLSTTTIGAASFLGEHPEWDGRGVLIAIVDSGVELGVRGLQTTSAGEPKILDARDFTDEGRIDLEPAERAEDEHGAAWVTPSGRWLYGADALQPPPADDAEVLAGSLAEADLAGGGLEDLNNDGDSADVFGLLAYRPAGAGADDPWVAVLDRDGDGDLTGEAAVRDFAVARESFTLGGRDRHAGADVARYALNLWPDESRAALYFDAVAHGTHVAGIAAGHGLNGQEGFDGIAPGAQLLALKIGDSRLGGATVPGSMLRAWRYAVEKAAELDMPLVIQMSYGVGSEAEGTADAERLIDDLLREHPAVAASVSAGNEGPGLSTIGLPAAAAEVLTVGAAIARTTAAVVYGADLPADRMFAFSSRGGELARPSLVAPGFAASSVPDWVERDVFQGTSMAAPQVAGALALLYSAARAEDLPVERDLAHGALVRTALPLPDYGPLDQGPGMAFVPAAWQAYRALAARPAGEAVALRARTRSPELAPQQGPAVFWRGAFFPRDGERIDVELQPVLSDDAPESFVREHYRPLRFAASAPWLRLATAEGYARQDVPARLVLELLPEALTRPGLYQTAVEVFDRRLTGSERALLGPELTVPVAVAVPYELAAAAVEHRADGLAPALVERVFFRPRPWHGAVRVTVELTGDPAGRDLAVELFDPEGRGVDSARLGPERPEAVFLLDAQRLAAGVWELDLVPRVASRAVDAVVRVEPFPLARSVDRVLELEHPPGAAPAAELPLTSALDVTWRGRGEGEVSGVVRRVAEEVTGPSFSHPFALAPGESSVAFEVELAPESWGLFTDVSLVVRGAGGEALAEDGLGYRRGRLEFTPPAGAAADARYTFEVEGATADPGLERPRWRLDLREVRRYARPVAIAVRQGDEASLVLDPDRTAALRLTLAEPPPALPEGARWAATLHLAPAREALPPLDLPLELEGR